MSPSNSTAKLSAEQRPIAPYSSSEKSATWNVAATKGQYIECIGKSHPKYENRPIIYMQGYNKWIALRFILHKANFVLLLLTSQILLFYIFINLLLNWTASNLTHLWEPPRIIGSQIVISMRTPGDHGPHHNNYLGWEDLPEVSSPVAQSCP